MPRKVDFNTLPDRKEEFLIYLRDGWSISKAQSMAIIADYEYRHLCREDKYFNNEIMKYKKEKNMQRRFK